MILAAIPRSEGVELCAEGDNTTISGADCALEPDGYSFSAFFDAPAVQIAGTR